MSEKNGRWPLLPTAGQPLDHIDQYLAQGGYAAARRAVGQLAPAAVVDLVERAGLRGLGGAGFPVARKWRAAQLHEGPRYLIANAYDADPASPIARAILETNPHSLLEGLAIAAHAVGAREAYVYARSEQSSALRRLRAAVAEAEEHGYLGHGTFDGRASLQVHIFAGWGGFSGGEETVALEAIEGRRAMPRQKPPLPVEKGLWGLPTVIQSAETLANLPLLVREGPEAFGAGHKILALSGDLARPGLYEVPLGTSLRQIVFGLGGGAVAGDSLRGVQIGGPSGAVLPESLLDTPLDFDALAQVGAFVGSGSVRALGGQVCMVSLARSCLSYLAQESCGKCVPCRLGCNRLAGTLEGIESGLGRASDLALLEEYATVLADGSLCGFGITAPVVIRSTMQHFAADYRAHIEEGRCPTGTCRPLRTRRFERKAAV
ncbi:MAG: complex I 51 kDa subunit family protein [Chloroflexota bacterium]